MDENCNDIAIYAIGFIDRGACSCQVSFNDKVCYSMILKPSFAFCKSPAN